MMLVVSVDAPHLSWVFVPHVFHHQSTSSLNTSSKAIPGQDAKRKTLTYEKSRIHSSWEISAVDVMSVWVKLMNLWEQPEWHRAEAGSHWRPVKVQGQCAVLGCQWHRGGDCAGVSKHRGEKCGVIVCCKFMERVRSFRMTKFLTRKISK